MTVAGMATQREAPVAFSAPTPPAQAHLATVHAQAPQTRPMTTALTAQSPRLGPTLPRHLAWGVRC
jgi:hypothetical protein